MEDAIKADKHLLRDFVLEFSGVMRFQLEPVEEPGLKDPILLRFVFPTEYRPKLVAFAA